LTSYLSNYAGLSTADRGEAAKVVQPLFEAARLTPPQQKAVWDALAVRDPDAPVVTNRKGQPEPDPDLRDQENVPLPQVRLGYEDDPTHRLATIEYRTAIDDHLEREVHPYVPDAWVDHDKTKVGYEVPLTRHFYKYIPPRPLKEIDAEIKQLEAEIQELLREVTE
jgi:type I restriction enzyme M protein